MMSDMSGIKTITCIKHGAKKIRAEHLEFVEACQEDANLSVSVLTTTHPKHAFELAQMAKTNAELIIILGGDGTINEVVNGLCSIPGENPTLFILPNGNGNDFIRNFSSTPLDKMSPAEILRQAPVEVRVPYLLTHNKKQFFINIADIGFGGHVVKNLNDYRKKHGHGFSYLLAILRTFRNHKAIPFSVEFNGQQKNQSYFMLAICHGSAFGKGLFIAPQKHPRDPHFQLVSLGQVSVWDYIKHVPQLYKGQPITHPEISYHETTKVIIKTQGQPTHCEIDGEYLESAFFEFGFSDSVVRVIC
jgi:YegS/Rv2252/BmrU family lipid kinase